MSRPIRNIAALALIALFLVPLAGFALGAVRGGAGVSETEKRTLATLPAFQRDVRAYTSELDRYFEDNFGARMSFIRLARKVRDNLGEDPPLVVTGKDGWLFLNNTRARDEFEGEGTWKDADVERWMSGLVGLSEALETRGIPFAAYVGVDKARLYPELLPDDWDEGARRFRTRLHSHPEAGAAKLVDAEPYLKAAKARGELVYWHRDTHWTVEGTYEFAMAVLDVLDPNSARPRYVPEPARSLPNTGLRDLEAMAGQTETMEPVHVAMPDPPAQAGFVVTDDADGPKAGQFRTWRMRGLPGAPQGRLVVVGDSFSDAVILHLRGSYSEIVRLHHGAHLFDVTLDDVLAERPDAVLFATAEREAPLKAVPVRLPEPR